MNIIGHEAQQAYLLRDLEQGTFPHAYLFVGPQSVGKRTVAEWYVSLLKPTECLRIERKMNDEGKRASSITVGQIREMISSLQRSTFDGGVRAIIIDEVECLNEEASNALLKNLEEPPKNTFFILIAHDLGGVMGTIHSRCCSVRFHLVPTPVITENLSSSAAEAIARASCGRPGVALQLCNENSFEHMQTRRSVIAALLDQPLSTRLLGCHEWSDEDTNILESILQDELRKSQPRTSLARLYDVLLRTRQGGGSSFAAIDHFFLMHTTV